MTICGVNIKNCHLFTQHSQQPSQQASLPLSNDCKINKHATPSSTLSWTSQACQTIKMNAMETQAFNDLQQFCIAVDPDCNTFGWSCVQQSNKKPCIQYLHEPSGLTLQSPGSAHLAVLAFAKLLSVLSLIASKCCDREGKVSWLFMWC